MVGEISDELFVPRFSGKYEKLTVGGREWVAISYENATVFVSATLGVVCPAGQTSMNEWAKYTAVPLDVTMENDLSVKQTAFKHDGVIRFCSERIDLGWIMIYEDKKIEDPAEYLSALDVREETYRGGLEPRGASYFKHHIRIGRGEEALIDHTFDPYE